MRSDKLDKKIIEAAENHHPAYDEKAWHNMKKLLDKHLPQEKKRRRGFFFFLLFFGLFGGAGLWYLLDSNKKNTKIITKSAPVITNELKDKNKKEENYVMNSNPEVDKKNNFANLNSTDVLLTENKVPLYAENTKNSQTENLIRINKSAFNKKVISNRNENKRNSNKENNQYKVQAMPDNISSKVEDISNPEERLNEKKDENLDKILKRNNDSASLAVAATDIESKPVLDIEEKNKNEKKGKTKNKKNNFFFLSLSAGPDISFVSSGKAGSVNIVGGAGFGYSMKNGISFRTGFYSGRKVYTTSPEAYHPPAGFSQYYPILGNIAADCMVYEIPLSVSYNFNSKTKGNWFAGAGVSSLIMKREEYAFDYKYTANGPTYKGNWSVNNENKHFFSVLTLSGGYQMPLNKAVYLSAEPYLKIPLQGIGYGKVNLNSTGVMFTLSVKPFNAGNIIKK